MKLETLLIASEMAAFNALLLEAAGAGAGAIRYYSATSSMAIIGICHAGELATWYCAPAHGNMEALLVQSVVLAGIAHTAAAVAQIQGNAAGVAQDAIKKCIKNELTLWTNSITMTNTSSTSNLDFDVPGGNTVKHQVQSLERIGCFKCGNVTAPRKEPRRSKGELHLLRFVFSRRGFFYARAIRGANMLFRKAELGQVDVTARSVPVVLATDYPVQRGDFLEILDLSKVDLSRGDLPLIESHDADELPIGLIRDIRVDGNKLRGVAVFGTSARATEVLADVQAGIITGVSIGYQLIGDGEPTVINGQPARTFAFMPYEASAVAIPADPQSGFFRSRKTVSLPKHSQGNSIMENVIENRNHATEISNTARQMSLPADLAMRAISEGKTLEEFQKMAIEALSVSAINTSGSITRTSDRNIDAIRVMRSAEDYRNHYATRGDFRSGVTLTDFLRGAARMKTSSEATRALAIGTDSSGGYALPSSVMPGILEALAPASSLLLAGAGILPLSDGAKTFNFAAVDALPVATWRAENGAVDESGPTFKNIAITPRSLSFMVKVSRELLADAANIETAVNAAIAQAFAIEIDRVGLLGTGTAPEPRGLKNTSGIQTVTNGDNGTALASYANIFSGIEKILTVNGPMPTAAIMAPRSMVRLGALQDSTDQPLQLPGMLQNVKLLQTSQLPIDLTVGTSDDCSQIFLGDFTKMFICLRESLNVQVLTETFADHGQIGFMCHARLDVAVQYPQAFCLISGVR